MIKKACIEDCNIISHLAIKLWSKHSIDDLMDEFKDILTSTKSVIYIYFDEIDAIAFAQCQLRYDYVEGTENSPVGYLEGIYVEEEYRQKGIASRLLKKCEKWSKSIGCKEFASDCELENLESFNFHLSLGFHEVNKIICFTKKLD